AGSGLYINSTGTRRSPAEIVEANFGSLDSGGILSLIDKKLADPTWATPNVDQLISGRMRKLDQYLNLVRSASPVQATELQRILAASGIRPRP
ncbi:MAG TPA: hypothetical protein VMU12_03205, partial [Candidatus Paceibacterota bacterium]|nr:hypothetical protein [Candidatus Paceibacterota bacterium]